MLSATDLFNLYGFFHFFCQANRANTTTFMRNSNKTAGVCHEIFFFSFPKISLGVEDEVLTQSKEVLCAR